MGCIGQPPHPVCQWSGSGILQNQGGGKRPKTYIFTHRHCATTYFSHIQHENKRSIEVTKSCRSYSNTKIINKKSHKYILLPSKKTKTTSIQKTGKKQRHKRKRWGPSWPWHQAYPRMQTWHLVPIQLPVKADWHSLHSHEQWKKTWLFSVYRGLYYPLI